MATHPHAPLPPIPAKRYFTIGEVSELCLVKPHVLRYWEQEFSSLKPVKRGGNRRYYQHHEVLLIRRIRELLYEQGFTIHGARNRIESAGSKPVKSDRALAETEHVSTADDVGGSSQPEGLSAQYLAQFKAELLQIRSDLLAAIQPGGSTAHSEGVGDSDALDSQPPAHLASTRTGKYV